MSERAATPCNGQRFEVPPAPPDEVGGGERGAALVEFALILPVFMMLVLGMFSGGLAYNHQSSLANAAREAARYGVTVAEAQCTPTSNCSGRTWAQLVQAVAVERANGDLTAAGVCVALVSGPGNAPVATDSAHTTQGGTSACYVDNSTDTGKRVQVTTSRPDTLEALVFTKHLTLHAEATAKYEQ
jgi:Flp pilus assembly protein TadG